MTRLVEFPQVSGRALWLNPDHVVSVEHGRGDTSWVTTPLGTRYNVDLEPAVATRYITGAHEGHEEARYQLWEIAKWLETKAEIRENLAR